MLKTFFERNQDRKSEHRQTADPAILSDLRFFLIAGRAVKRKLTFCSLTLLSFHEPRRILYCSGLLCMHRRHLPV